MVKTTTNSTHGFGTLNQFFSSLPLNMDSQGPRERSEKISLKKKKRKPGASRDYKRRRQMPRNYQKYSRSERIH